VLPSIFGVSPGSVVGAGTLNTLPQGKIAKSSAAEIQQKSTAGSNTVQIRVMVQELGFLLFQSLHR